MADIVVVMRDGFIEQIGRPLDLYDDPKNSFVAGFIGSPAMNFLPVTTEAGSATFSFGDGQSLSLAKFKHLQGEFLIGIRPEHFHQQKTRNGLSVTIESIEQTGAETLLQCQSGDQKVVIVLHDRFAASLGEKYRFGFDLADLHLFEAESGKAISR